MKLALFLEPRDAISYVEDLSKAGHVIDSVILTHPTAYPQTHLNLIKKYVSQVIFLEISKWKGLRVLLKNRGLDYLGVINFYLNDSYLSELQELVTDLNLKTLRVFYSDFIDDSGYDVLFWQIRNSYKNLGSFCFYDFTNKKVLNLDYELVGRLSNLNYGLILKEIQERAIYHFAAFLGFLNSGNDLTEFTPVLNTDFKSKTIDLNDTQIKSDMTVEEALNLIKACNPNYGAWYFYRTGSIIIWDASLEEDTDKFCIELSNGKIYVECAQLEYGYFNGKDALKLKEIYG